MKHAPLLLTALLMLPLAVLKAAEAGASAPLTIGSLAELEGAIRGLGRV